MTRGLLRRVMLVLFCGSVTLAGLCFFLIKFQVDNKYAFDHQATQGILTEETFLQIQDLTFLWDGWEFYPQILLDPEALHQGNYAPTYIYIGAFGGFAQHGGCATYRLTIEVPDPKQALALEIPHIFGNHRLWINGELRRIGTADGADAAPPYLTVTPVAGEIEIILAVEAYGQLYDGLVYPPAFGSEQAVWRLLQARLFYSAVISGCALFLAILYLIVGLRVQKRWLALSFAFLCFCYTASILRIPMASLGLAGGIWLGRVCYYGIFLAVMSILVEILHVKQGVRRTSLFLGIAMCVWVFWFQLYGLEGGARSMRFFSASIQWYKYAVAAFLIVISAIATVRDQPHGMPLLLGGLFFASALIADRFYPKYEPALLQWPVETAALFQIGAIAWVLISDAIQVYGSNIRLEEQQKSAKALMEEQARQYTVLARHLEEFAEVRHNMRGVLLSLKCKFRERAFQGAEALIDQTLGVTASPAATPNILINAIIAILQEEAARNGIQMQCRLRALPVKLNIEDTDLSILLTNLIHNALEACGHLPKDRDKTIQISFSYQDHTLYFSCTNPYEGTLLFLGGRPVSRKGTWGHGLGLRSADEIVRRYGGLLTLEGVDGVFRAMLSLQC